MQPPPSIDAIKAAIAEEFSEKLDVTLEPGGLTDTEACRLSDEIGFYRDRKWIHCRSLPSIESDPIRSIIQTPGGSLRVHLWLEPRGNRIRQALIVGDFFTVPGRLINDLEAALVGVKADYQALSRAVGTFLDSSQGQILGASNALICKAVASTIDRLELLKAGFSKSEANDLFLVNLNANDILLHKPKWLLLPYCSKNVDCALRQVAGCVECGECEISQCFSLARSFKMEPITIQSFEHLMTVLRDKCKVQDGIYIGSCCEPFYSKHQTEMGQVEAGGILVNLDCTTCYDLGKGMAAYEGRFENKTFLNMNLIEKAIRNIHGRTEPL